MMMLTVGVPTTSKRTKFSPADGPTSARPGRPVRSRCSCSARSPAAWACGLAATPAAVELGSSRQW